MITPNVLIPQLTMTGGSWAVLALGSMVWLIMFPSLSTSWDWLCVLFESDLKRFAVIELPVLCLCSDMDCAEILPLDLADACQYTTH